MVIKFSCRLRGHPAEGPVVNPAGWFGKVWLIEIPNGPLMAVEADHEQDAIDVLADDPEWGHWINDPEGSSTAGNDSHPVDLSTLKMWPAPVGISYHTSWSPLMWHKTEMLYQSVKEHDKEVV
jgi:hypothetical protein